MNGPLPRRVSRQHLEPQLAEPWGTGSGTQFAAFEGSDADVDGAAVTTELDSAQIAAAFRDGTERGRAAT